MQIWDELILIAQSDARFDDLLSLNITKDALLGFVFLAQKLSVLLADLLAVLVLDHVLVVLLHSIQHFHEEAKLRVHGSVRGRRRLCHDP